MVGVGRGAEKGILIKDAESLETLHNVNAVILDKTGTITEGVPKVTDILFFKNDDYLKDILLKIESQSEHPLANAVYDYLKNLGFNNNHLEISDFKSLTGSGVEAIFNKNRYYVGNQKLMSNKGVLIENDVLKTVKEWQNRAKTVIYFAENQSLIAIIAIADPIKETSKAAIHQLQKSGIKVYMLTGDNTLTAEKVAQQTGIKHFRGEVLPSDKADFIKKLQSEGKIVAMVGDGINDSHALAQADVSVAMGKGSDIAMDVAKMTLISSDLQAIPKAINLSKKTVATIKQNLFWAFIYNIIGIPIAAGILYPYNGFLLNPMIAGAAMAMSSVSVVTNSLRLRTA
jgi:Cu2+-exporting ATPase